MLLYTPGIIAYSLCVVESEAVRGYSCSPCESKHWQIQGMAGHFLPYRRCGNVGRPTLLLTQYRSLRHADRGEWCKCSAICCIRYFVQHRVNLGGKDLAPGTEDEEDLQ